MLTRVRAPQNDEEKTPLHAAARYGRLDAARLLQEAGADINAKDTVSERSMGDGGLGVRTRQNFDKSWQPWGDPRRPTRNGRLLSGADK